MPNLPHLTQNTMQETPSRCDRTPIYQGIGRLIWSQYCLENDIVRTPFEHAPEMFKRSILEASEALANMALDPDRRDAALMAMADGICCGTYGGALTIFNVAQKAQQQYLTTAESALQAFLLNLLDVPPDANYRNEMSRMIDALAPKKGVQ